MAKLAISNTDTDGFTSKINVEEKQFSADVERQKLIPKLSTKEQNQFKLVEKVCNQLAKNDVKFYLFTLQPGEVVNGCIKDTLYHWNANGKFVSYNSDSSFTEESKDYLKRMNNGLIWWIYRVIFCNNFLSNFTNEQKWDSICKTINYAIHEQIEYFKK